VFSLTFSGAKENKEVKLVDFEEEKHVPAREGERGEEMSLSLSLSLSDHVTPISRGPKESPGGGGVNGKPAVLGVGSSG
jgi:hypothetical protein